MALCQTSSTLTLLLLPVCISMLIPFPSCTDLQHGCDLTNYNLPELEVAHGMK